MHNQEIYNRSFINKKNVKTYKLPSGREVYYDGYENYCIEYLLKYYNEDEIKYTNVDHNGVYSTNKGLQSFTDKKYLNEFNKSLISNIKNTVQIIIPVLSLIIAVAVLFLKIDSATLQLKESIDNEYKSDIEMLKFQMDSIKQSKLNINKEYDKFD